MSHDEERARGTRLEQQRDRAPRHWLDPLVLSVSLHSCFQRAFNCPVHQFVAWEKPVFRVIALIAVFIDGKVPASFATGVIQSTDMSEVARVISIQVKELALETRDVMRTRPRQFLLVELINDTQSLFPDLNGNWHLIDFGFHLDDSKTEQ